MVLAFSALLTILAIAIVAIPFFRISKEPDTFSQQPSESLRSQRESIYQALETLRLERELGQVDDQEYQRQLREYRYQAAAALQMEEQMDSDHGQLEDVLEAEVLAARAKLRNLDPRRENDSRWVDEACSWRC